MQLCQVEHFYNIFVLNLGVIAEYNRITPKSEDKYVEKVFNSTELHFSEVTSFKIGTLNETCSTLTQDASEGGPYLDLSCDEKPRVISGMEDGTSNPL